MSQFDKIRDEQLRKLISKSQVFAEMPEDEQNQLIILLNSDDSEERNKIIALFEEEASTEGVNDEDLINSINEGKKNLIQLEKEFEKTKNAIVEGEEREEETEVAEKMLNQLK